MSRCCLGRPLEVGLGATREGERIYFNASNSVHALTGNTSIVYEGPGWRAWVDLRHISRTRCCGQTRAQRPIPPTSLSTVRRGYVVFGVFPSRNWECNAYTVPFVKACNEERTKRMNIRGRTNHWHGKITRDRNPLLPLAPLTAFPHKSDRQVAAQHAALDYSRSMPMTSMGSLPLTRALILPLSNPDTSSRPLPPPGKRRRLRRPGLHVPQKRSLGGRFNQGQQTIDAPTEY